MHELWVAPQSRYERKGRVDNPEEITVLSLCSGYGGLELGISRSLANPLRVIAVEIEAYAMANLVAKAEEGKLAIEALYPDIKTFPAERFSGCFDFVLAGYPCQPFSVAGKRAGTNDPRHLWSHIARIIEAVRPVWCFLENVAGHLSLGFPEVYCSLRDMGYSVEAGLFTASEVGAPHKRQRLFILANAEGTRYPTRIPGITLSSEGGCKGRDAGLVNRSPKGATKCHNQKYAQDVAKQRSSREYVKRERSVKDAGLLLAHADSAGSQEPRPSGLEPAHTSTVSRWPARPSQPQYEWEEPRVVVENSGKGRTGDNDRKARRGTRCEDVRQGNGTAGSIRADTASELADTGSPTSEGLPQSEERNLDREVGDSGGQGQAQSGVGRAANGPAARVDRLRLLGNGVVPQQAEKAFRHLIPAPPASAGLVFTP